MTKAFLKFTLLPAMLLATLLGARAVDAAGDQYKYVSTAVKAAGSRSTTLYTVPSGMRLLITQTCQEHPAMYVEVGERGDRISYNGHGCTKFEPGYAVTGGQTLNCVNKSGQERTCVLVGLLESAPRTTAGGARFYNVD